MIKKALIVIMAIVLAVNSMSVFAQNIKELERFVEKQVEEHPDASWEYFVQNIEEGATLEEQAIYLYGMGLANETLGNIDEAINDYLAAEALGNESASKALSRIQKKR